MKPVPLFVLAALILVIFLLTARMVLERHERHEFWNAQPWPAEDYGPNPLETP